MSLTDPAPPWGWASYFWWIQDQHQASVYIHLNFMIKQLQHFGILWANAVCMFSSRLLSRPRLGRLTGQKPAAVTRRRRMKPQWAAPARSSPDELPLIRRRISRADRSLESWWTMSCSRFVTRGWIWTMWLCKFPPHINIKSVCFLVLHGGGCFFLFFFLHHISKENFSMFSLLLFNSYLLIFILHWRNNIKWNEMKKC